MKVKFFNAAAYKGKSLKISKQRLYQLALKEACIELCLEGQYNTYQSARIAMISRAKKNYQL